MKRLVLFVVGIMLLTLLPVKQMQAAAAEPAMPEMQMYWKNAQGEYLATQTQIKDNTTVGGHVAYVWAGVTGHDTLGISLRTTPYVPGLTIIADFSAIERHAAGTNVTAATDYLNGTYYVEHTLQNTEFTIATVTLTITMVISEKTQMIAPTFTIESPPVIANYYTHDQLPETCKNTGNQSTELYNKSDLSNVSNVVLDCNNIGKIEFNHSFDFLDADF